MPTIYLALGSNLGNREENIQRAIQELKKNSVSIDRVSSLLETEPVGGPPQGKFLNAVLQAQTDILPADLLKLVKSIEIDLGRTPTVRNGPRVIDIDILLYNRQKIDTPSLTIPHPRMMERDFVLQPLKEIAPDLAKELTA